MEADIEIVAVFLPKGGYLLIIQSSTVGMESVRRYSSLRMDAYGISGSAMAAAPDKNITVNESNSRQVSPDSKGSFQSSMENLMKRFETMGTSRITHNHDEESAMNRIKTECIIYLLRLLFGRETDDDVDTKNFREALDDTSDSKGSGSFLTGINNPYYGNMISSGMRSSLNSMFSLKNYEAHYFAESEELSYQTTGTVVTADGRKLDFNLSFEMSRSFEEYYEREHTLDISKLCDPLVINLDTDIANVSDQKFMFDIDSDGIKDNISMLNKGSGFLALDRNGDGEINNGNELFGTKSGDGFKDLAAYDSDGNGWIDEADPIWNKLLIYSINEDGSSSMYGLSEKGVGAIYLGNVSTNYSLNNSMTNNVNAVIRKTGMFLYENGQAGTIQHLDVAS